MTVIEADEVETEPLTVDRVTIFASQRYSVVGTAKQTIGNYCIFVRFHLSEWSADLSLGIRVNPTAGTTGFANGINSAILQYTRAKLVESTTQQSGSISILNEADLHVNCLLTYLPCTEAHPLSSSLWSNRVLYV